jgi:plasmid stabilization system protein ParE
VRIRSGRLRTAQPDAPHVSLTWSPLAYRQVADALGHIADDDPAAARRWLDQLLERIESLARFPDCGRVVPEYGRDDVREIMIGSYRVMYRRRDDSIEVAAVHHHARRLPE